MAVCAVHRELLGHVIRICCGVEVIGMATCTSIGRIVVIAIVTGRTVVGNGRVRAE
jgi:hypothetical protein